MRSSGWVEHPAIIDAIPPSTNDLTPIVDGFWVEVIMRKIGIGEKRRRFDGNGIMLLGGNF